MTRGLRIRIIIFVTLSALGIVYVSSSYLGVVDRILGRGYTVTVSLPVSGGLFEGSEVTYRGVKVGRVRAMDATPEGVEVLVAVEDDVRIPAGSPVRVQNLSAVGEQYLDFLPTGDQEPYLAQGDRVEGGADAIPVREDALLVELDRFVQSVDGDDLATVVTELGDIFRDTAGPLQQLLDSGTRFIDEASDNTDATRQLLRSGLTVLATQAEQGDNIGSFSRDLRLLTRTLRDSDRNLRRTLDRTPAAVREVEQLLVDLEPTLPVLLGNLVTVNQVVVAHLAGVEQLLVTFPIAIATGYTGTTPEGFGRVSLQFEQQPGPCREGYMPPSQWRQGNDVTDAPIFPARCDAGPPFNMRGSKYAPAPADVGAASRTYRGSYDPATGLVDGAVGPGGRPVRLGDQGDLSILGGDAWKWLMAGPVASR